MDLSKTNLKLSNPVHRSTAARTAIFSIIASSGTLPAEENSCKSCSFHWPCNVNDRTRVATFLVTKALRPIANGLDDPKPSGLSSLYLMVLYEERVIFS